MLRLSILTLALVCLLKFGQASSHGEEIGFLGEFSIGGNRTNALTELVSGTIPYYYYQGAAKQNRSLL